MTFLVLMIKICIQVQIKDFETRIFNPKSH